VLKEEVVQGESEGVQGESEGVKPIHETASVGVAKGELKRDGKIKGSLREAKPLLYKNLPLPLIKGKGLKGIGFKTNLQ